MNVAAADLQLTPSLDETRELAREHTLVPVRHTFIADCETPVSAYLKLRGDGPSFLLESAEQGQQVGRWSFLGFRPRAVIRLDRGEHPDPYAAVAEELARYRIAPLDGLPPFAGGAVGMFGYDLVRSAEPSVGEPNPDDTGMPELAVMVTDVLLAFDHLRHEVTVLANVVAEGDVERAYQEAAAAIADVRERLRGPVPQVGTGRTEPPSFSSNLGPDGYAEDVERAKEYIRAGDVYQVVPSQRWSADCPVDAFSIYRGLRAINPSPYMYFLDFEDFEIAGASPEALVTVTGRTVRQRPIAGTRPRADSVEQDLERARELLADPKERAEHVMLVDLGRNDLGRVCEYGSVKVDELMTVETYSHVMHIVSSVSGTLTPDVSPMDALRASLPAGTLSGAPKIRAMQIIDELEPVGRGPYGGAVGYLSYTGDLDTCIYIRSALVKDGQRAHPGRRRHRRGLGPGVRGARDRGEGRRGDGRDPAGLRPGGLGMTSVLVVDNYDSFTYNLVQYLGELGADVEVVRNDLPELLERSPDRVIVSPGPCTPEEAGLSKEAIRRYAEDGVPVLGVCLGHQALAAAYGGRVVRGEPVHGKTAEAEHDGRTIFDGLESPLVVGRYHSLVVDPELPEELEVSARSGDVIMGLRHRELPLEGVQFHPESVLTPHGKELLRNFLHAE